MRRVGKGGRKAQDLSPRDLNPQDLDRKTGKRTN